MIHDRNNKFSVMIPSQGMTNSATVTANLDTAGADYATIVVNLASEINTNAIGPTLSLLEDDTTVATNFATIVADRSAEDITAAKTVVYGVDLRGRQRYLRLSCTTATATNDNVEVSATAILSRNTEGPAGTTGVGDAVVYA